MPDRVDPAAFADLADPAAVRLSRRILQGNIHMLDAQIAQLSEIVRALEDRESELSQPQPPPGSGGRPKEGPQ